MTPQEYIGVDPYGNTSKMAKIVISETAFLPLVKISQTGNHILSMWMFSNADRTVTLYYGDKNIELNLTTSWQSYEHKMELAVDDGIYLELPAGTYYIWHAQLERATKKSDWIVAPEDIDASVDAKLEKYATLEIMDDKISLVAASTQTYTDNAVDEMGASVDAKLENYATLEVTNNKISTAVTETRTYTDGKANDAVSTAKSYTDQTAKSITSTVEGIVIGGRNLLLGSANPVNKFSWASSNGSATVTEETMLGAKGVLIDVTTAPTGWQFCQYAFGPSRMELIKPDTYYTLSFDVYPSIGDVVYFNIMDSNATNAASSYSEHKNIVANQWNHISLTVKTYSTITISYQVIYILGINSVATYKFCNFKLEEGNKATDWTPAPEDTEESITEVKTIAEQTADKFSWIVKSGTSETNFELTDRTASLVANHINLNGLVTFSGLNSDTQDKIDTIQSTADAAKEKADGLGVVHTFNPNGNSNMYVEFADITILATYINTPISFRIVSRGYEASDVQLCFNSRNNTNPNLNYFCSNGNVPLWIQNTGTSKWRIITKKSEALGGFSINNYYNPVGVKIDWVGVHLESVPDGSISSGKLQEGRDAAAANKAIADWCYNNDKTYINGGKIYTGSIAAKQINVSDLFAQDITATGTITGATLRSVHVESTSGSIGGFNIGADSLSLRELDGNSTFYIGLATKTLDGDAFGSLTSYWKMSGAGTQYGGYVQISHGELEAGYIAGTAPSYNPTFRITGQGDVYLPKIESELEVEGNITLPNDYQICGRNTSGSERENIRPCDRNNNFVLGYGSYSASEGATNIYGKNVSIIANGSITFNPSGTIKAPSRTLTTLWNGALYMGEGHSISLSDPISKQLNGIVLAWSAYVNNAAQDYWWNYTFIPKAHVSKHGGEAIGITLTGGHLGYKYVYINSTTITGSADNNKASKVISGVTFEPNYYVLRHVFGV